MILTCYACHNSSVITGWNPLRQTVTCLTPSCGRSVYVGEAAERMYGPKVGKDVKDIIAGLSRVAGRGKDSLAYLVDITASRIEAVMSATEWARGGEKPNYDAVARAIERIRAAARKKLLRHTSPHSGAVS